MRDRGTESGEADWPEVLRAELVEVDASRARRLPGWTPRQRPETDAAAEKSQLVGLAFSGGGIRSATFNLGVLRSLARTGLLRRIDYLSTVSGGGYIGCWLAAWLKRQGDEAFDVVAPALERGDSDEIRALRRSSNYLTPRAGAFGTDAAHTAAAVLRNLYLNLVTVILFLAGALLLVLAVHELVVTHVEKLDAPWLQVALWASVGLAFLFALICLADSIYKLFVRRDVHAGSPTEREASRGWTTRRRVWAEAILFLVGCWVAGQLLGRGSAFEWTFSATRILIFGSFALGYPLLCALAWAVASRSAPRLAETGSARRREILGWGVPAGLLAGALLAWLDYELATWRPSTVFALSGPLVATAFILTVWLHVGLVGDTLPEETREWIARFNGTLGLATLGLLLGLGIPVYAPGALNDLTASPGGGSDPIGALAKAAASAAWGGTTLGAVAMASRGVADGRARRILLSVAPYVFGLGLLVVLSAVLADTLELLATSPWRPAWILAAAVACCALAALLSSRTGVNLFSLHGIYRNRLVRCYLGASRSERRPDPLTDLDPDDDIALYSLAGYPGPYPLINATLNLVASRHLPWQQRRSASFFLAPRFSGFLASEDSGEVAGRPSWIGDRGFRETKRWAAGKGSREDRDRVGLGTAMAISGAAVSPSMGDATSRGLSLLLTLFNVRLGAWLGNPRSRQHWQEPEPTLGLLQSLKEILGQTTEWKRFVYLSDGGHFDNLGLYELVRRRCRFVVVSDAEADEELAFSGLGNAIERCRTDLGIEIELDVAAIRADPATRHSGRHCAVGRIRYDLDDPSAEPGTLVYMKASLTGKEPVDVLRYAAQHPSFPHQGPHDQWFGESQFECYRALGEHIADSVLAAVRLDDLVDEQRDPERRWLPIGERTETYFLRLRQRWHPESHGARHFSRHGEALNRIVAELRQSPDLRFLEPQFYLEWGRLTRVEGGVRIGQLGLPKSNEELRQGFHMCSQMIQLMENVYTDLGLESQHEHPDHRGWMNLFHRWAWSSMFRATWGVTSSTYGARFQEWCERHLDLGMGSGGLGRLEARQVVSSRDSSSLLAWLDAGTELTFLELQLLRGYLRANPGTKGAIWSLELVVDHPIQLRAPDHRETLCRIHLGVALIERSYVRYFRIQNQVRRTGFGRAALLALREAHRGLDLDGDQGKYFDAARTEMWREPPDLRGFSRLFASVRLSAPE